MAELALFAPSEATGSGKARGARERGYFTTAQRALARLRKAGITPAIVKETFEAMRPPMLRALARSPSVLLAVDRIGPYEAFEGGLFRAAARAYQGTWLDLEAIVFACPLRSTAELLQAMHLHEVLAEVAEDVPVRLLTANGPRRRSDRATPKVAFDAASQLPRILGALRVPPRKKAIEDGDDLREELLRNLRARSVAARFEEPRIRTLATIIAKTGRTLTPMPSAHMAQPRKPTPPPAVLTLVEPPASDFDPQALLEELRGHTQLLRGEDQLRAVAQHLSVLSDRSPAQVELGVLASRTWLAAGEPNHARHFARRVTENPDTADAIRLLAQEILESTAKHATVVPPPPPVEQKPIVPMPILMASPHHQFAPSGASLPPVARVGAATIFMPAVSAVPHFDDPRPKQATVVEAIEPAQSPRPTPMPSGEIPVFFEETAPPSSKPPAAPPVSVALARVTPHAERAQRAERAERPERAQPAEPPERADSEIVESLKLPQGLSEAMLPEGTRPSTPEQARIEMIRLARGLGRDYRLWYGTTLVTSVIAIDAMQRHLRRRFDQSAVAKQDAESVERELLRHGALLSEILARALGGRWVDVPADKPGHWSMLLYPDIRIWPIGRIYRFFQQGHREADLVAYYLDFETQVRRQA